MAISPAQREAQSPAPDYAQQITEEVRTRIAPEDWVLDETRNRRGKVGKAAERFRGALRSFASGSLAHRTVNNRSPTATPASCSTASCGSSSVPTAAVKDPTRSCASWAGSSATSCATSTRTSRSS